MVRLNVRGVVVTVDAWLLFGVVFLYAWSGGERVGVLAAITGALFAVVHELGHLAVATRVGTATAMRLDPLRGADDPSVERTLSRRQLLALRLAGPLCVIAVSLPLLGFAHAELERRIGAGDVTGAHWLLDIWSGLAWGSLSLALLGLLPLWPLDGGHAVAGLLPRRRAERTMASVTLYALAALVVLNLAARTGAPGSLVREEQRAVSVPLRVLDRSFLPALGQELRAFPGRLLQASWFLAVVCGLASLQVLAAARDDRAWLGRAPVVPGRPERRRRERTGNDAAYAAERDGWRDGELRRYPTGWTASPWLRAHVASRHGDEPAARAALSELVVRGGARWPAVDPERAELAALLPLAPDPLPVGAARRSLALLAVLTEHADAERITDYAERLFAAQRDPDALLLAAAGLARVGRGDEAMAWLTRAVAARPDAELVTRDRRLVPLHDRLDFQQLVASLRADAG